MNSPKYRVFVCTKQRSSNAPEGCCYHRGALEIYQAFQSEIKQRQIENQVEIRRSGCLDRCEAGAVVLVDQQQHHELSWLPKKIQRLFFSNKHWYGRLNCADIPKLVESHLLKGQSLKQSQI